MARLPLAASHATPGRGTPAALPPTQSALSASDRTDVVLLESARTGDRMAFTLLVQRHQSAVYSYLRAHLLEPADAEDLCQEVFLRTYSSPGKLPERIVVRAWLLGIARNTLREHVRRVKRRKEVAWTELCLELDDRTQPDDAQFDASVAALPACLDELGQSARSALDWYYRAQTRLADIGLRLRRSEGAVKLLLFRARQALRNCLEHKRAARHD